jgi:hypothetical protein
MIYLVIAMDEAGEEVTRMWEDQWPELEGWLDDSVAATEFTVLENQKLKEQLKQMMKNMMMQKQLNDVLSFSQVLRPQNDG